MEINLRSFFELNNLDFENKTFVLAVSTGVDSSVLLDEFIKFKNEYKINIIVVHCNHHKREESETEEAYLKNYCLSKNIEIYVKELYFDNTKDNFQALARDARYEFFNEVIVSKKADYLVLAHHADDLLETILMRFTRGSSLAGYGGINSVIVGNNYKIIRPLLSISKENIYKIASENKIKFFEDDSNSSNVYTRNRFRHNIIPLLKEECPNVLDKALEFSETIFEVSKLSNHYRDEFINIYCIKKDNMIEFNRNNFLELSKFMQEEVLFELLKKYSLSKANILELNKIIHSRKVNFELYFKKMFYFIIEYEKVILDFNEQKKDNFGIVNINIDKCGKYKVNDKIFINVSENEHNNITNLNELWYNIDSLPIIIRTREPGDKIKLSTGYKKVNKLLIDLKITKDKRDALLLGCKGDEVLIVFGIKKSVLLKECVDNNIVIKMEEI